MGIAIIKAVVRDFRTWGFEWSSLGGIESRWKWMSLVTLLVGGGLSGAREQNVSTYLALPCSPASSLQVLS